MKLDRKTYASRVVLIVVCLLITITCYLRMNESYDPLARYAYATEENRDIILTYLNSDDINYIINQQIEPDKFMDFIEIEGFNVHNTLLYYNAKRGQDEDNEFIVNFVNRYRNHLTNTTMYDLASHYSYMDLTTFFETESIINGGLKLIANPTEPLLLLNQGNSVYKYVPKGLKKINSFKIKNEAKENLIELLNAYRKIIGKDLGIEQAYISYEDSMNRYVTLQEKFGENVDYVVNMAGCDEGQLGYTVELKGTAEWLDMCLEANVFESLEYDNMILENKYSTETIEWLNENAYRYGFVIRYPEGKEELTNHIYQPFLIRFVGIKNAKKVQTNHSCLEEEAFRNLE